MLGYEWIQIISITAFAFRSLLGLLTSRTQVMWPLSSVAVLPEIYQHSTRMMDDPFASLSNSLAVVLTEEQSLGAGPFSTVSRP